MKLFVLTGLLVMAQNVWAELPAGLGGSLSFTNNYSYRGINRYSDNRSLNANVEYSMENGLYAGIWVGNYKPVWSNDTDTETDIYVGINYNFKFDHNIDSSVWQGRYRENTIRDYDWIEWQISYHYHDRWGFTYAISDNLYGSDGRSNFAELSFVQQTRLLTLNLAVGSQRFDAEYLSDVTYLRMRISRDWLHWHLFLDNTVTDLKSDSAAYSQYWKTTSTGIGVAYTF